MEPHEPHEIEHQSHNKRIGMIIAAMAAALAFTEMAGNNAATDVVRETVEASDTWAFFQAKTIRAAMLRADAQALRAQSAGASAAASPEIAKTLADWEATAAREDSEPSTGEGRKELAVKAQAIEKHRDDRDAAKETYELASGALELGILLASTSIVTGVAGLVLLGGGFGVIGAMLGVLGWIAPHLIGGLLG
jgi:hypothetical protein